MPMTIELKEDIYKNLLEDRTILYNDEIDDDIIEKVVIPIIKINEADDNAPIDREQVPIHLYLNTHGGAALETLSVVSAIEASKTPVYTYALGKAMSGGFFILIAGHKRFAQKYSTLCYHQVHTSVPSGPHKSIEESLEQTKIIHDMFSDLVTRRTKINKKIIDEVLHKKLDWFVNPEKALKLDIIDEIL